MTIETRGRKPNTTPINERVCLRGHVGQYRKRGDTIACHECSKIAVARFKARGGTTYRPMPLEHRVCRHGHVGKYVLSPRGYARCTECSKLATKAYLERSRDTTREELALAKLLKRREYLTRELAELALRIALEETLIQQRRDGA